MGAFNEMAAQAEAVGALAQSIIAIVSTIVALLFFIWLRNVNK